MCFRVAVFALGEWNISPGLGQYPDILLSSQVSATHLKIGHPEISSTDARCSNELQWLDLQIGHQDNNTKWPPRWRVLLHVYRSSQCQWSDVEGYGWHWSPTNYTKNSWKGHGCEWILWRIARLAFHCHKPEIMKIKNIFASNLNWRKMCSSSWTCNVTIFKLGLNDLEFLSGTIWHRVLIRSTSHRTNRRRDEKKFYNDDTENK